jgi:predicted PurR-regulated permease PerM
VAVLGFWGLALVGINVPFGTLFGIAIGLATAIPLAGLLFAIPAALLTLLEPGATAWHLAGVAGVYLLVQGVEAVLIPVIMGREVELHPVTLIVALLLCGKLLGVLGLILAVPIAATVRILAREFLWPRLREMASDPKGWWRTPRSSPDAGRPPEDAGRT